MFFKREDQTLYVGQYSSVSVVFYFQTMILVLPIAQEN